MRTILLSVLVFCLIAPATFARNLRSPIGAVQSVTEHDLVIAECLSVDPTERETGLGPTRYATVKVLKVLNGDRKLGELQIATTRPIQPGVAYLLSANPAFIAQGPDFLAVGGLSVVPLPANFDLAELEGQEVKEQVEIIWSRHLFEVEREIERLLAKKKLLENALADRKSVWFESAGPVELGEIRQSSTQSEGKTVWLDLQGNRLQWSQSTPGKNGFVCFEKMGTTPWNPGWEFSPCAAKEIGELDGKPLKAKFYGQFTPRGDETGLRWNGLRTIRVEVGQVLLARTVEDPHTVYIIRIVTQSAAEESMAFRYAAIHD